MTLIDKTLIFETNLDMLFIFSIILLCVHQIFFIIKNITISSKKVKQNIMVLGSAEMPITDTPKPEKAMPR